PLSARRALQRRRHLSANDVQLDGSADADGFPLSQRRALRRPGGRAARDQARAAAEPSRLTGAAIMPPLRMPGEVLEFWFSEQSGPLWFEKNTAFDEEIRSGFGANVAAAGLGDLDYWVRAVDSSLALVLLLDQFPRNIHRSTLRAYAGDVRARATANT